eukprot:CAMPEP_0182895264 /NCGR_PEP_ID=MMETSP0034_2-20130328/25578_1 /TAXON_ID=156128 /ORGANISM="Nephroselmis pyriformis, Strain CCMP717" /LENGTH=932 /DNA_ID=CAMNT_0025029089 /DNA_START=67 /DNA_END=2862 /DNA_ORIENTATION=-
MMPLSHEWREGASTSSIAEETIPEMTASVRRASLPTQLGSTLLQPAAAGKHSGPSSPVRPSSSGHPSTTASAAKYLHFPDVTEGLKKAAGVVKMLGIGEHEGPAEYDLEAMYRRTKFMQQKMDKASRFSTTGRTLNQATSKALLSNQPLAEIAPEKPAFSVSVVGLFTNIILPTNKWYERWYVFTIILVIYSAVMTPMRVAFFADFEPKDDVKGIRALKRESDGQEILDYCIDFCFFLDIIITCRLAFVDSDSDKLITNSRKVFFAYVFSWTFLFDILATFPFEKVYTMITKEREQFVGLLGLFRLIRVKRILVVFNRLEASPTISYAMTRITKFSCIVFCAVHWAGCLFWYLAALDSFGDGTWVYANAYDLVYTDPDAFGQCALNVTHGIGDLHCADEDATWYEQYIRSLYWAVTTLTTVGYGDISPGNNYQEIIVMCFFMIINMALSAYLLGNMTVLLTSADQSVADYRLAMAGLEKFVRRNDLPADLADQMRGFVEMQHRAREMNYEVMQSMPIAIRSRIVRCMYKECTDKAFFTKGTSPHFQDFLLSSMQVTQVVGQTWLIQETDLPDNMYVMTSGQAICAARNPGDRSEFVSIARIGDEAARRKYDDRYKQAKDASNHGPASEPADKSKGDSAEEAAAAALSPGQKMFATAVRQLIQRQDSETSSSSDDDFGIADGWDAYGGSHHEGETNFKQGRPPAIAAICGSHAFLTGTEHVYSVRTITECTMLAIGRSNWEQMCAQFPKDILRVTKNILHQTTHLIEDLQHEIDALTRLVDSGLEATIGPGPPDLGHGDSDSDVEGGQGKKKRPSDIRPSAFGRSDSNDREKANRGSLLSAKKSFKQRKEVIKDEVLDMGTKILIRILDLKKVGLSKLMGCKHGLEIQVKKLSSDAKEKVLDMVKHNRLPDLRRLAVSSHRPGNDGRSARKSS